MTYGEYPKIHTLFKRDMTQPRHPLLEGQWTCPEFAYLAENIWIFTEKVDGTNIRVEIAPGRVVWSGKTAKAQLPAPLAARLQDRFLPQVARLEEMFPAGACLYGEGYGPQIGKNGQQYHADQDFVLFDVRVGSWWLSREDVKTIALKLGIEAVPVLDKGSLWDAVEWVKNGFCSSWGDFPAEGIVARPQVELQNCGGERIITKIKRDDFGNESRNDAPANLQQRSSKWA